MNRRSFLWGAGALLSARESSAQRISGTTLDTRIMRLNLRHTWTTTMSSSEYRDTLHVTYSREGITGHGEGAPIVRYHEDAASARQAVESLRDLLLSADPMQFSNSWARSSGACRAHGPEKRPWISR